MFGNKKLKEEIMALQEKLEKAQKSTPGLGVYGGDITASEYDDISRDTLIEDYIKMRNGDCIASTSIDILTLPILTGGHSFRADKENTKYKQAVEYIEHTFDSFLYSYDDYKRHCLLYLPYGHILFEYVWITDEWNGAITKRLAYMSPIQYETIHEYLYTENMHFKGIKHTKETLNGGIKFVDIYLDKLQLITNDQEFNDVRGRSILRPARMAWKYKQDILIGTSTAIRRGGMIPRFTVMEGATDETSSISKCKTMGRTIANTKEAYIIDAENQYKFNPVILQGQTQNMPMLQYLDRQMLFNTLSQFITTGIGENGSRAATEAHKSPYEMRSLAVLNDLQRAHQKMIDKILDESHLILAFDERPQIQLESLKQHDLTKVRENLAGLVQSKLIDITPELKVLINKMFGLPELTVKQIEQIEEEKKQIAEQIAQPKEEEEKEDKKEDALSLEYDLDTMVIKDSISDIFSLQSAIEHYEEMAKQTKDKLNALYAKALNDAIEQIESNGSFRLRFKREAQQAMGDFYDKGFNRGRRDFNKEVDKLKNNNKDLEIINLQVGRKKSSILRAIDRLWTALEDGLNRIVAMPKQAISQVGGLREYATVKLKDSYKKNKNAVIFTVENSYTDGRARASEENKDVIRLLEYTAILDKNVCINCAPLDGSQFTFKEGIDLGLNMLSGPLNPLCEGGDACRCQLVPLEVI
jgi:hypothetical protein